METWFWILGWVLSFLTITGNGFTIFLVCSRRNLRTKTNAFIVSLAVADFCVGLSVIPSMFFCTDIITNTCHRSQLWIMNIRLLFSNTSAVNLCGLVLDRFIAIVHPLKYITLMTRPRIIQVISFSWVLPVSFNVLKVTLYTFFFKTLPVPFIWLSIIFFEFLPSAVLMLFFVSMIFHVRRHDQSARTLAKQLRFNHQMSCKILHERSAVIMMGLVIGVFLVCYGMYLRCSFTILFHTTSCNDEKYKIPFLVLNSAINPLVYASFKRDIKKEFKRLVGAMF